MRMIVCLFLLVNLSSIAHAQKVRVDRIDIIGKRIYQVTVGKLIPDKRAPTGVVASVIKVTKSEDTATLHARIGLEFGIQYVIVGSPKGALVPIRIVNVYPNQGLRNPKTHRIVRRVEFVRNKIVGDVIDAGYAFENGWEIVPGRWRFELWYKNRELVEQSFIVRKP